MSNSSEQVAVPEVIPNEEQLSLPDVLPVLALRDTVVFPYIIVPLSISREQSVQAVDQALSEHRLLMLVTQKDPSTDEPTADDLHPIGTAALIMRMLKLPDGRIRILVQGLQRALVEHFNDDAGYLRAQIKKLEDTPAYQPAADRTEDPTGGSEETEADLEIEALLRSVKEHLERVIQLGKNISQEVMVIAANLDDPGRLADLAASNLELDSDAAQEILETIAPIERLRKVNELLMRESQLLSMQEEISSQARVEMDRTQREYFLRQQLKAIQSELGEGEELNEVITAYREQAEARSLPTEAAEEVDKQIKRLERSHPDSAETAVIRTYLDWLTGLPWNTYSTDRLDLEHARQVLDRDHFGLDKIKERILEYLAVRQLNPEKKGPILCFVGPPGVGKTSLGRSIAEALDRRFVRISLGGVRDEAEIRGHRRTYVGALPGRILQGLHRAATNNPVFILDEIDKLGASVQGDPSSALLEVLDPEQNSTFRDHYLGLAYDLSRVMFITTANLLEPIQPAFRDRMEIVRLSGYTPQEKHEIAKRHLVPKQLQEHGLTKRHLEITPAALRTIIQDHTREAGLRNLERELAALCRKIAVRVASAAPKNAALKNSSPAKGKKKAAQKKANGKAATDITKVRVTRDRVAEYLGPAKHFTEELLSRDRVGIAAGLAWTAAGGDLLFIEVLVLEGKGRLVLTGRLGAVMKESAHAALSCIRSLSDEFGLEEQFFDRHDLHVHVPAGSIPKDGPSAGITIATALASVLTGRPVDRRLAMTGEITLRGDVLPIGGLREKVLAARSAGVKKILIPKLNERDLEEIPEQYKEGVEILPVERIGDVLELALKS